MTTKRLIAVILVISVAVAIVALSCTDETSDPPGTTDPPGATDLPIITSLEVTSDRVFPLGSTEIMCIASCPDGEELSYEWSCDDGEIEGTGDMVTWTAPDSDGDYRITVTVISHSGGRDTRDTTIQVQANRPPVITSLTADAAWTTPTGYLRITCEAVDPDGDELSYHWTATGGSISGPGAIVTWTAPEDVGEYEVTVVVSDGHGGSDTGTLRVSVETGQPPFITTLEVTKDRHGHCYLIEVIVGGELLYMVGRQQMYDIECTAHHPDHLELSYEWECEDGEIEGEGPTITWTAPNTSRYVTVTVTVSDSAGRTARESVKLDVVICSDCTFRGCP